MRWFRSPTSKSHKTNKSRPKCYIKVNIYSLLLTGGVRKLEGMEADVVESLIVENHTLVSVFNELMHRERCIIWLNNSVRDLRRRKQELFTKN